MCFLVQKIRGGLFCQCRGAQIRLKSGIDLHSLYRINGFKRDLGTLTFVWIFANMFNVM